MIDISQLNIGDKVHYQPSNYREDEYENGIIKEIPDISIFSVRVVYNCAGDWRNYKNYTSALTSIADLKLGWKHE